MSAQSTLMTAVKATQRGAFEYLPKPFDLKEVLAVVARALATPAVPVQSALAPQTEEQMSLIGRSVVMQDIYRIIARLTTSDLTVMINGESGTGKELVHARCMITGAGARGRSWPSTWPPSRAT